jgi:hypothetical protein
VQDGFYKWQQVLDLVRPGTDRDDREFPASEILKGSTARKANLILGRTRGRPSGRMNPSTIVCAMKRNCIVHYVESNPVSAGLAANPREWHWSSARWAGGSACPTIGANSREM